MVGHAALAFALAAGAAAYLGIEHEEALLFGAVAGAFAVVPDVDIGYAVVGLATTGSVDLASLPDVFWETGNTVHRGLTHSFVVETVAALLFGLLAHRGRWRAVAVAGLAGVVVVTVAVLGALEGGVLASFLLAGAAVTLGARRWTGLWPRTVFAAALVGLLSHPFGDVFTGTSPTLLYPFDVSLLPERVLLSSDPTLHLLGAFATELATVWLAVVVYFSLRDRPLFGCFRRRAALGTGYAGTVLLLPAPTLAVSYQFVFSVLAAGAVVALVGRSTVEVRSAHARRTALVTGLSTVTVAWLAYLVAYRLVG